MVDYKRLAKIVGVWVGLIVGVIVLLLTVALIRTLTLEVGDVWPWGVKVCRVHG